MNKLCKISIVLSLLQGPLFANPIDKSIKVIEKTNTKLKSFQHKINSNEEQREDYFNKYKYINANIKSTNIYNNQLVKIIKSQEGEISSLEQQLIEIEETQKNILPLMIDMIKSLKSLIKQDTPFLLSERLERVERLENTLNKANIQTHEKYRIILEAFKIEYDYAKSLESYQDKIGDRTYNFLRLGRTALYYQSLDLKEYGYFRKDTRTWENISDISAKSNIRKAIKIARKQQNVTLLNLPFLANKESK